ncbi:MAG: ComEC/Rec2 family competence protein [Erysipelotrichaceae bacterium]
MKNLKNLSLFKTAVLLILNIYFQNILILILSVLFLFIINKKDSLFFIFILIIIIFTNIINIDFIPVGIVEETKNSYVVVDKLFYKELIYEDLNVGDVILIKSDNKIEEENTLKYNYRFKEYDKNNIKYLFNLKTRQFTAKRLNSFSAEAKGYLNKILFNSYSENIELEYLGYGFAFYYILLSINRKNRYLSLLLLAVYYLFYGFDIKFYLIIIDIILKDRIKGIDKLSIKIIVLLIINYNLLLNNSILLSLIFSYLYNSQLKEDRSLILVIQSFFFYETNLLSLFIYRYLIKLRIILFIVSLITFIFKISDDIYLIIINIFSFIFSKTTFSLRGYIPAIILIIIYFIFYKFKINQRIKMTVIILLLLIPLNTIFPYISFFDVGQGNATYLNYSLDSGHILIDTGSSYNYHKLKKELYKRGIYTLDYVIISHDDEDHSGNLESLQKDFKVKNIITEGIDLDEYYLKYLYAGSYDNKNDNSLVYLYEYNDLSVLIPGDISKTVENILTAEYDLKDTDILLTGHHGSNTSSDPYFIGTLNLKTAIISTNGKYAHPSPETVDTLNKYQVNIFSTKENGTISVFCIKDYCFVTSRNKVLSFVK